jgi:NTP pyrophosphatase (non-canonical NTP hydrolase)
MSDKFIADAIRTKSPKFNGSLVGKNEFMRGLADIIGTGERADRLKKLLFYGEDVAKGRVATAANVEPKTSNAIRANLADAIRAACANFDNPPDMETIEAATVDIVHAIFGVVTEASEMVEALVKAITGPEGGRDFDLTNFVEELGDVMWYLAIAFNALSQLTGVTHDFATTGTRVTDKLRERFPEKFTTDNANNRDTDKERKALSKK